MCKVTSEGYELPNGNVIPFDADISEINPEDINELNEETSTAWDSFLLHREINTLSVTIGENHNIMIKKLEDFQKSHSRACPLNHDGIAIVAEEVIEEKLNERGINTKKSIRSFFRDILLVLSTATAVGLFLKLFGVGS